MWVTLLFVLSWITDAIGFGYTPMVLLLWTAFRLFPGSRSRLDRVLISTNTLVLCAGILVCLDMITTWLLGRILLGRWDDPLGHKPMADQNAIQYAIGLSISRFFVLGALPLIFLDRTRRSQIKWSLVVISIWFVWENVMDFVRHGYLCFCDYRPIKTYGLLLLTFTALCATTYWLGERRRAK